jgi:transcriptional regulator with XRE-family HTH domain
MTAASDELPASIGGPLAMAAMLRRVRHDRGLSEKELAARIDRPVSLVTRLEAAEITDPGLLTAAILARGCEVSVALFAVAFSLPVGEPLPWPREHQPALVGERIAHFPRTPAMGATIRDLRLRKGWTVLELAGRTGIHRNHLSAIERGAGQGVRLLTLTRIGYGFATSTAERLRYVALLAMSYAGEIEAPPARLDEPET